MDRKMRKTAPSAPIFNTRGLGPETWRDDPDPSLLVEGYRLFPGLFIALAFLAISLFANVVGASFAHAVENPAATPQAAILMYHRFGEGDYPSTNITIEQFEAHIAELQSGGFSVVPLGDVIAALRNKTPLPDKAVAITVDDAYLSIYTEAWPRLKAAGFPFTVFVSTEAVDRATSGAYTRYLTWDQLRELKADGVTFGHHTETHLHMPDADAARNETEIRRASERFQTELGAVPDIFAYPYGESSAEAAEIVRAAGFVAALGQHSGAAGPSDDLFNLPRFALNEDYGDLDRFRLVVRTLHLPISDAEPGNMLVDPANNPPLMGFTVDEKIGSSRNLACYIGGDDGVTMERLGDVRIEVRASQPFGQGRTRLNCTMAGPDGRWYWFGRQFYLP